MAKLLTLISLNLLSLSAHAHMQMSSPFPLRSPLDPAVPVADKDYDYTSPLHPDGSNFPCKGYAANMPFVSKATYTPGQTYEVTFSGTTNHGGGSCQLSLSYDTGATFKVIKSIIGGCMVATSFNFTIPEFAPAGNVLFAWTWFNLIGNREMYMDCAQVEISGTSPGRHRRAQYKRQGSMSSLPNIFVANVDASSQCKTIEGEDVQFPEPGSDVIHGTDLIADQPGSGFACTGPTTSVDSAGSFAQPGSPASSSAAASSSSSSSNSPTASVTTTTMSSAASSTIAPPFLNSTTLAPNVTTTSTTTTTATSTATSLSTVILTTGISSSTSISSAAPTITSTAASSSTAAPSTSSTTSSPSSLPTTPSGTCIPGTFICDSPTTFSACSNNAYIFNGAVAAGMTCQDGNIIRINDGPCSPNGSLRCGSNGYTFFECDQGGLIDMGPVAAGTQCVDGQIRYAPGFGR